MASVTTAETKQFPTAVIASLSSGILLCEMQQLHEAAEYLMGHPIWTHHFASKELWNAMQAKVLEQCSGMPTKVEDVNAENYQEKVAELVAALGPVVTIRKGDGTTAMHPLDGLPEGKPVIMLQKNES